MWNEINKNFNFEKEEIAAQLNSLKKVKKYLIYNPSDLPSDFPFDSIFSMRRLYGSIQLYINWWAKQKDIL